MPMTERRIGLLIVEGQRHEVWLETGRDEAGAWHNALLFRRDGMLSSGEGVRAGLDWHLPPDAAAERAARQQEAEWLELYLHALRPRPPVA